MKAYYGYKSIRPEVNFKITEEQIEVRTISVIKQFVKNCVIVICTIAVMVIGLIGAYKDPQSFALGFSVGIMSGMSAGRRQ